MFPVKTLRSGPPWGPPPQILQHTHFIWRLRLHFSALRQILTVGGGGITCPPASCLPASEIKTTGTARCRQREERSARAPLRASELCTAALNITLPQLQAKVCFPLKLRAKNVPSDDDYRSNQQSSDRNQTRAETRLQAAAA